MKRVVPSLMLIELHPGQPLVFLDLQTLSNKGFGLFRYLDIRGKGDFLLSHDVIVQGDDAVAHPGMATVYHLEQKSADAPDITFRGVRLFS